MTEQHRSQRSPGSLLTVWGPYTPLLHCAPFHLAACQGSLVVAEKQGNKNWVSFFKVYKFLTITWNIDHAEALETYTIIPRLIQRSVLILCRQTNLGRLMTGKKRCLIVFFFLFCSCVFYLHHRIVLCFGHNNFFTTKLRCFLKRSTS